MALFDKLNQVAKNLGDKTTDAIETTKLNTKIHTERNAAAEEFKKIGEYYYNVYISGGNVAPEVMEFCQRAKAHSDEIEAAQAGIEQIKIDNEVPKTMAAPVQQYGTAMAEAPVMESTPTGTGYTCTACGAVNAEGTKFCFECGNKLEAPVQAASMVCPNCGAAIAEGLKFCGECGNRIG